MVFDSNLTKRLPLPAGKLVRGGSGGRGTPYCYTATRKGQASVAEARRRLGADAELLARGRAEAGGAGAGEGADDGAVGDGSSDSSQAVAAVGQTVEQGQQQE
jgi:hypothetical protein